MRKVIQTDILYFSIWKIICYLQWLLFRSGKLIGKLFSVSFFCITLTPCIILVLSWISMPLTKFKVMVVVQSLSRVWFFATLWTAACKASLSFTVSQSWLKPMSIESVMPFNHFILCCPFLPLSIFPSINIFSNELALCDPMDCSMQGFPVLHCLLEFAQIPVCRVGDAIQPSYLLLSPSPPALSLSQPQGLFQHQGLFQWVSSLHQVAKLLELHLQHQSFQWIFRFDFL